MDATNSTLIGRDQGWCTRTVAPNPTGVSSWGTQSGTRRANQGAYECHWTVTLFSSTHGVPDQLMVEGPFYDQADADGNVGTLAITGGTGLHNGARGYMALYDRKTPTQEYDFVYCIDPQT
jgi:hypothetical protein